MALITILSMDPPFSSEDSKSNYETLLQ